MRRKVNDEEFRLASENKDNINVMRTVTNRYRGCISEEDLKSCALLGLWRCLGYHDDTKQKFTTSLWRFTDWECKRELAKKKSMKNNVNVQSIIDLDIMAPAENENIIHVKECLELLAEEDKEVIQQYYFEKRTMEEIGQIHQYSKEAARQKIRKAVVKLREICCEGVS